MTDHDRGTPGGYLALSCTRAGGIVDVLCDDAGLFAACAPESSPTTSQDPFARVRGRMLSGFVAAGGTQHFAHFIDRLAARGAVNEWLIDLQDGGDPITYRLWGVVRESSGEPELDGAELAPVGEALIVGAADLELGGGAVVEALEARLPDPAALADYLRALRAQVGDRDAVVEDLRAQVRDLHGQVQPPMALENRLLRMAAHDLRNPLLVLSMGCSYLLHEAQGLSQEQRDMLSESLDTCEFMNRLVDGMAELADVAVGRLRLLREPTDLAVLVERAVRHGETLASERSSSLALVRVTPVSLAVDPVRLARVVSQLVTNALIHCPEGTEVKVWLDRGEGEAVIAVADDGPGIPQSLRDTLFRPFGKPHGDIDPRYYGAGVGLAVARRIVEAHHGRLEVETTPGAGTCFRLVLPLPL